MTSFLVENRYFLTIQHLSPILDPEITYFSAISHQKHQFLNKKCDFYRKLPFSHLIAEQMYNYSTVGQTWSVLDKTLHFSSWKLAISNQKMLFWAQNPNYIIVKTIFATKKTFMLPNADFNMINIIFSIENYRLIFLINFE